MVVGDEDLRIKSGGANGLLPSFFRSKPTFSPHHPAPKNDTTVFYETVKKNVMGKPGYRTNGSRNFL